MVACQPLLYGKHTVCVREGSCAARRTKAQGRRKRLEGASAYATRKLKRGRTTGAWLTIMPNRLNGTELSTEAFRDNLRLRYGYIPLHLSCTCDGCSAKFTVQHALSCPKGGLVLIRHDNTSWEFVELGK
eukprot:1458794-Ditylum_brightwellii.AAC.1